MNDVINKKNVVIAIDSGDKQSGVVIIIDNQISYAATSPNEEIVDMIKQYIGVRYRLRVIVEDIRPYSLKLSMNVIETCKWIGELRYRLKSARIAAKYIGRSEVKAWVYNKFPEIVEPMIRSKINKKGLVNKDGGERKSSFIWVDDKIIVAAMRSYWELQPSIRGKKNEYGLASHSFQALGLATYYLKSVIPSPKNLLP